MKVRVDTINSSPSSLFLGVQIHGPRDSWLRFAEIEIPFSQIPWETVWQIREHWELRIPEGQDESLF